VTNEIKKCPNCYAELRERLVEDGEGYYSTKYTCPNAANHGKTVKCGNNCGKEVPNSQFHYHYTPGLIGSGGWVCFPKSFVEKSPIMEEVRQGKEALQRMRDKALKEKDSDAGRNS